jgi:hypothetical protein
VSDVRRRDLRCSSSFIEDVGGRTKMVMTHAGIPGDSPGAAGWAMALDKLAAHVKAHSAR